MNKKQDTSITVTYDENLVVIQCVKGDKLDVLVLDYDEIEQLAYIIRRSPYGY